jgi:hypothetical protein
VHTVTYFSTDAEGGVERPRTLEVAVNDPPVTTAHLLPAPVGGQVVGPATVVLSATDDGAGIATIEYALDGAPFQTYEGPVTVAALGDHTLSYRAMDGDGALETIKQLSFTVVAPEKVEPVIEKVVEPVIEKVEVVKPPVSPTPPPTPGPGTTPTKATAHLVGGVKLLDGKLTATVACDGSTGSCQVILEITDGKSAMDVPVTVVAGKKKTVTVKPSKVLLQATKSHPKARLSARLVAPEGKAQKVKAG